MWISRRELQRLERELSQALKRASEAEAELRRERAAKDTLVVQLASRVITKHGGYGLDEPERPAPPPHPKRFTHEPSETDLAKLDYYKQCYLQAGRPVEEAEAIWEAEMRGETPVYPYESEVEQ